MVYAVWSVTSNRFSRLCVFLVALLCAATSESLALPTSPNFSDLDPANPQSPAQAQVQAPLVSFQVTEPVFTPNGSNNETGCVYSQVLMSHVFANSYGVPYTGMILQVAVMESLISNRI